MRLIDADRLVDSLMYTRDYLQVLYEDAEEGAAKGAWGRKLVDCMEMIRRVKDMPTIEPPPVVRCKDCLHADPHTWFEGTDRVWCSKRESCEQTDGFCHKGEREETAHEDTRCV